MIVILHFFCTIPQREKGKMRYIQAGSYTLKGNQYTEHLEYCSDRAWEGHDFNFTLLLKNDTLVQTGREKVESAGIDRVNTEKYIRLR